MYTIKTDYKIKELLKNKALRILPDKSMKKKNPTHLPIQTEIVKRT